MIYYIIQSLGWLAALMLLRQNSLLMTRINWLKLEVLAHQLTVKRLEGKLSRSPFSPVDDNPRLIYSSSRLRSASPGQPGEDAKVS